MNLEQLSAYGTQVSDLKPLHGLEKLRLVYLSRVDANHVKRLRKVLPNCDVFVYGPFNK